MDKNQKIIFGVAGIAFIALIFIYSGEEQVEEQINEEDEITVLAELEAKVKESITVKEKDIKKSVLETIRDQQRTEMLLNDIDEKNSISIFDFDKDLFSITKDTIPISTTEVDAEEIKVKKKVVRVYKKKVAVNKVVMPVIVKKSRRTRSRTSSNNNRVKEVDNSKSSLCNAVIHGDQSIRSGGNVLVRLTEDYKTENGDILPRNTYINLLSSFSDSRLSLVTSSVNLKKGRVKLEINAFDSNDSREGIDIFGSVTQDLKKNASRDAISEIAGSLNFTGSSTLSNSIQDVSENRVVELKNGDKILLSIY